MKNKKRRKKNRKDPRPRFCTNVPFVSTLVDLVPAKQATEISEAERYRQNYEFAAQFVGNNILGRIRIEERIKAGDVPPPSASFLQQAEEWERIKAFLAESRARDERWLEEEGFRLFGVISNRAEFSPEHQDDPGLIRRFINRVLKFYYFNVDAET